MKSLIVPLAFFAVVAAAPAHAEDGESACAGAPVSGIVVDTTGAIIPSATVSLENGARVTAGSDGHFRFPCVSDGSHHLQITASSFAKRDFAVEVPMHKALNAVLAPEEVQTTVDVGDDAAQNSTATNATNSGPAQTISGKQLNSLADDPDDLLRELQQLSAASGGAPSNATVAVDGFDNAEGTTHLPPKSSIAYIKVNPDLFSAEYRNPPFGGGRIEVYTKPGQSAFHGALFATNSSAWMNARDPFAISAGSIGKQRYGFELTGPIRKQGSDFSLNLEHRSIDTIGVVNAVTVDAAGNESPIVQDVPTPQRLWIGNARVDWQLGPKNTFIASVSTYNNDRLNQGVGGNSLAETGYERTDYDTNLHLTDVTTISPKIMHEARVGLEWDGQQYTPNSLAPQVSVAGAFTGGGSTFGRFTQRELDAEVVDDAIIQTKSHLIKIGIQPEFVTIHTVATNNFNGTYTFGGGVTSSGATITGIQQYVNALNGAANGSPTAYSGVAGNPVVDVFQFRNAIYFQDDWKILSNLHFAYGLRYYTQTAPTVVDAINPRFGVSWSPDKKATWNLHAHAGLFSGRSSAHTWAQFLEMDGVQRVTSTVYNPTCSGAFDPNTCTPLTNGMAIHSMRTLQPDIPNLFYDIENLGFSKTFPKKFTLSADYYIGQMWHYWRSENINAPLNGSPTGPRPGPADTNIFQMQASGRGYANVEFFGLTNQALKRVQFFAGAVRVDVVDDTDDNPFFTPQTTGVNAGEYARRDNQGLWQVFGNATLNLPGKIVLSSNSNGQGLAVYNVTTGFDNNGDGDFNDRPQYARAGTPLCSVNPNAAPCGYSTPWGELVTSGGISSLPRNKGYMPWTFYLDSNVQRAFKLTRDAKAEHPQTLTVNVRSSNILNHMNVTSVGTVLGSPFFGRPYAADNGRRVEAGLRYSF
ncbi:MAG TPA: carboxypeptidase regulatory-like domain-containing protein [Acidobacteriaceae bacterium]|nr:carboxypeptidase regulatory-like domain-containing protein [Acidobacteriaceae bacterium]